jgi:hypothetical protein
MKLRLLSPGVQSYRQMALIVRAQRVLKRVAGVLAVALIIVVSAPPAAWAERATGAALLKVEFIERFTRFIEWPRGVLGEAQPRFVVCIAGTGPVADELPGSAPNRFKGRPAEFRRVRVGEDLTGCHLLFIGASEAAHLPAFVAATARHPVLTIADLDGAAERGVLINFYPQGTRVLFEINREAAAKSGLEIGARLLQLARVVGPAIK